MLALYRSGRQAEALQNFRAFRSSLAAENGTPGPELADLELAILRNDRSLAPPSVAAHRASEAQATGNAVPRQLPADVVPLAGDAGLLDRLDDLLEHRADGPGPLVIALSGGARAGKTSLAVHWAHRVGGRFPDGQLFAGLGGTSASAVPPIEALRGFLHALGTLPHRIPAQVDDAAALYRSLLADRRVLVVLDDVRDPAQVRPLLPGGPGCAVVVTSRARLDGLVARDGAAIVDLDAT